MDGAVRKPVRDEIDGGVGRAVAHDSARLHVRGEAIYIDDIPQVPGTLQAHIAQSTKAHARIASLDVSQVRVAPGVIAVLTAADIPGDNDVSPTPTDDDPVFAKGLVEYVGQSIFAVVADTLANARAIDDALAGRLKKAVGFRNIAVHNYGEIDWTIVHALARRHLGDFTEFARIIAATLTSH